VDKKLQDILNELVCHSQNSGIPLVPPQVACHLFILAQTASPSRIVEVGTGFGYSTLLLVLAAPDSRIITIEKNEECGKVAQDFFRRLKIDDRISLVLGDAPSVLRNFTGTFDFVFLDAAKEQYLTYLQLLLPRLSRGAVIVADDVFFDANIHGQYPVEQAKKINNELKDFRRFLQEKHYFVTSFLPIDCGVSVTLLTEKPSVSASNNRENYLSLIRHQGDQI
jgi:predicted O-methyltransferase YrrM